MWVMLPPCHAPAVRPHLQQHCLSAAWEPTQSVEASEASAATVIPEAGSVSALCCRQGPLVSPGGFSPSLPFCFISEIPVSRVAAEEGVSSFPQLQLSWRAVVRARQTGSHPPSCPAQPSPDTTQEPE